MTWYMLFFLAGWFSAVAGFEIAPMWGNVSALLSFSALIVIKALLNRREDKP